MSETTILLAVVGGVLLFACMPICACYLEVFTGNLPRYNQSGLSNSEIQQRIEI